MHPMAARIEPRIVTPAVVTIPANTSEMPNAKTIGHAVGEGSEGYNWCRKAEFTDPLGRLDDVHVRHLDIHKDNVKMRAVRIH